MKGLVLAALLILGLGSIGCTTSTPVVETPVHPGPAPTRLIVTAAPPTLSPTALPPTISTTTAPQIILGATKTYRDEFAGFEFDYPATWNLTPVSDDAKKTSVIYSSTFFSWKPTGGSSEGIPAGGTKLDAAVYKNGASSPEAALEMRKQEYKNGDMEQTITSEKAWTLPGGLKATRLQVNSHFGESAEVITAINGKTILLGGVGDYKLFDAVAGTLRKIE